MISHAHRLIFIHVPKTAGTSVEAALGHHGELGVRRDVQDHRSLRQVQWPHGGLAHVTSLDNAREAGRAVKARIRRHEHPANRLTVSRDQYNTYLKFGVVRNPWSRAFSWYQNVMADPLHQQRLAVAADLPFAAFVERWAGRDLLRPQTHWLIDAGGRVGVDMVCRFETLAADFAAVCARAELPSPSLPMLNRSSAGGGYAGEYDDRSRRLVGDRHRVEIELFGYSFDSYDPRPIRTPTRT